MPLAPGTVLDPGNPAVNTGQHGLCSKRSCRRWGSRPPTSLLAKPLSKVTDNAGPVEHLTGVGPFERLSEEAVLISFKLFLVFLYECLRNALLTILDI